ncbi:unnamed protein product [Microthlaspi erraticum]|uniref:Uncharacterized protein n=1 Tax=Microthlaspi erraticum TaxID=1685480 RepID=A0A6D2HM65_9BRAS|nr:unnamed protein product [Microthlaspi erraticum]
MQENEMVLQGCVFGYLSAPQRTGSKVVVWRGRRPSGALHSTSSLDRACGSSSSYPQSGCGSLALVELASSNAVWVLCSGEVLVRCWIVSNPKLAPPGQLDLSSIELSFLCWTRSSPVVELERLALELFLLLCVLLPLARKRGSVRLLGREPPWSGEERSTPREGSLGDFFFLLEEPETFFSKLLILLTILSMDFCIFSMAFPCHLLNFWRSPILLWAATTEGFILMPN